MERKSLLLRGLLITVSCIPSSRLLSHVPHSSVGFVRQVSFSWSRNCWSVTQSRRSRKFATIYLAICVAVVLIPTLSRLLWLQQARATSAKGLYPMKKPNYSPLGLDGEKQSRKALQITETEW